MHLKVFVNSSTIVVLSEIQKSNISIEQLQENLNILQNSLNILQNNVQFSNFSLDNINIQK